MRFLTIVAVLAGLATAVPTPAAETTTAKSCSAVCKNPRVRKEWRSLSISERKQYLNAVVCMTKKPSKAPANLTLGVVSRFDDFNAVHIMSSDGLVQGTGGVHMVGFFLAWHRLFTWSYETALRDECGYTGAQPYWDWRIDADSGVPMAEWEIYNPSHGFGGNGDFVLEQNVTASWPYLAGQTGGGCVNDGPFKDTVMNVGPGSTLTHNPHCLRRGLNPDTIPWLTSARVAIAQAKADFLSYDAAVQGAQDMNPADGIQLFHGSGHYIHGGDSTDFISSSTEPIFYLHHAFLDKLYWEWQMMNPTVRLSEIGGVRIPFHPDSGPVALTDILDMKFAYKSGVEIKKVMNIRNGELCYTYQ
ncbi:hypothetical protein BZA05DRAFT_347983 [Tricharina praecox]|uniref:uncharacterized protein n=1 Tax=Tricharina praecox TaxID=43433 RepID=UPI00221FB880|nr:uncharacterized protein BZA05DRAFT_347983 [Tricharina praecox]KAI5856888.1 hypothetical protein BZA05DRAFT_347983 [Tricharina praecox]